MPGKSYIADSSALVAILSARDQHHPWIIAQAARLPPPWVTCEGALTEAFHLVEQAGTVKLKEMLRREALATSFDLAANMEPVLDLMDKYSGVPMSLTDACLVRMSEILSDPIIITVDGDFQIYRRHSRQVIPCLMP